MYKYHEKKKAYIEIISYDKLIVDSETGSHTVRHRLNLRPRLCQLHLAGRSAQIHEVKSVANRFKPIERFLKSDRIQMTTSFFRASKKDRSPDSLLIYFYNLFSLQYFPYRVLFRSHSSDITFIPQRIQCSLHCSYGFGYLIRNFIP